MEPGEGWQTQTKPGEGERELEDRQVGRLTGSLRDRKAYREQEV